MTVQQKDNLTNNWHHPIQEQAVSLATPQRMAVTHPFIHLFILFGIFIQPDKFKAYQMRLNPTERLHFQRQGQRLTALLVWMPTLIIFVAIWATKLVLFPIDQAVFALILALLATLSALKYGNTHSVETENNLLLATLCAGFSITAVLISGLQDVAHYGGEVIMLILLNFLCTLTALCVAMVFRLKTLDKLCGMMALFTVSIIAITMSQVMTHIWIPVFVILCAILTVGITEERHGLDKTA